MERTEREGIGFAALGFVIGVSLVMWWGVIWTAIQMWRWVR